MSIVVVIIGNDRIAIRRINCKPTAFIGDIARFRREMRKMVRPGIITNLQFIIVAGINRIIANFTFSACINFTGFPI